MFEAIVFVAGAVLFFLAVLYFVILWQDRVMLARRHRQLQTELATMKEQRIDLEIRERELRVWAEGLEHQQRAITKAEEELRMLTASQLPLEGTPVGSSERDRGLAQEGARTRGSFRGLAAKNKKQQSASEPGKLPV